MGRVVGLGHAMTMRLQAFSLHLAASCLFGEEENTFRSGLPASIFNS